MGKASLLYQPFDAKHWTCQGLKSEGADSSYKEATFSKKEEITEAERSEKRLQFALMSAIVSLLSDTRSTTAFLTHTLYQVTGTVFHLLLNTMYVKENMHEGIVSLIEKKKGGLCLMIAEESQRI